MRSLLVALTALALAAPLGAQQGTAADPDNVVAGGGKFPSGWSARIDRDRPADNAVFTTMGNGFHATLGPSGVFYNKDWTKKGNYKVSARFTQTKAPAHPEAYGIFIGGDDLSDPDQEYTYFVVRGTGQYYIATRKGAQVTAVQPWTAHDAVAKQDAAGKQVNVLGAEVRGDDVIFTVNGTEVARRPKSQVSHEGIFGFRINHNLDVHIDQVTR